MCEKNEKCPKCAQPVLAEDDQTMRWLTIDSQEVVPWRHVVIDDRARVNLSGTAQAPSVHEGRVTMVSKRGLQVEIVGVGTRFAKWHNVRSVGRQIGPLPAEESLRRLRRGPLSSTKHIFLRPERMCADTPPQNGSPLVVFTNGEGFALVRFDPKAGAFVHCDTGAPFQRAIHRFLYLG